MKIPNVATMICFFMSTSDARLCIRPPVRDEKSNLQKHLITLFARPTLGDIPSILDFRFWTIGF
jgi:hypothetical protein